MLTAAAHDGRHINVRIDGGAFPLEDGERSRLLEQDTSQTHRLLEAIEQQKMAVEHELARLRDAAGMSHYSEWRDPAHPGIKFIQRQNPRLVISRDAEVKLLRKTRANWSLPKL